MAVNGNLNSIIADTLIEKPTSITIGGRQFSFHPPTLGLTLLLSQLTNGLEMDADMLRLSPAIEAVRQAENNRNAVAVIVATATTKGREDAFNAELINERADIFKQLPAEELAQLLLLTMQPTDISKLTKELGIDREHDLMQQAIGAKKDNKNNLSFGGVSLWGNLIDRACERYGWTFDYVLWGISYANLQLMLADMPTSIYLSDKESRRVHIPSDRTTVKADNPANRAKLAQMFA